MAGILKVDRIQEANSGQGVELSHKLVDTSGNTIISENSNGVATFGASVAPSTNYTFRNKIINGNLKSARVINQRGATSIAPSGSTGYTYDRWYFDGSTYLYQGIEDKNVNNGTYVISWVGSDITAEYLLSIGPIPSLTREVVDKFLKYYVDVRVQQLGMEPMFNQEKTDVITWFENYKDLNKDNPALQESDLAVYSIGIMQNDVPEGQINLDELVQQYIGTV